MVIGHDAVGDGQAQTIAVIHGADLIGPVKPLENAALLLFWDLGAGIGHPQQAVSPVALREGELHGPAGSGVLPGVVQQDLRHLPQGILQIGARVDGYASSIGRPVVFGKATPEQRELIEVGYKAQADAIASLMPGVKACDVAQKHIENVTAMGYGDWLLYGPCHGNGTMEGEAPWIETTSDYLLEENMTFCVDIFLGSAKTETGLRMEDVVCVKRDGAENLTNYPRKLFEIDC